MTQNTAPTAGWYPDPAHPDLQFRWWDGTQWSDHTSPIQQQQANTMSFLPAVAPGPTYESQNTAVQGEVVDPRFDYDQFVIKQKIKPILNIYEICAPRKGGMTSQQPNATIDVCSVRQKRMSLRERISVKGTNDQELMYLQSQKILDVRGKSDIYDERGTLIGRLQKDFKASLLRSRWYVLTPDDKRIAEVRESNTFLAILRRIANLSDWLRLIVTFIPYGFTITAGAEAREFGVVPGTDLGTHNRRFGLRDHYDLDLRNDTTRLIDRRVAVMLAVALDCLQNR